MPKELGQNDEGEITDKWWIFQKSSGYSSCRISKINSKMLEKHYGKGKEDEKGRKMSTKEKSKGNYREMEEIYGESEEIKI